MKQTSNTLKFLSAQYRAIYKHAFLLGLGLVAVGGLNINSARAEYQDFGENTFSNYDTITINGERSADGRNGYYKWLYVNLNNKNPIEYDKLFRFMSNARGSLDLSAFRNDNRDATLKIKKGIYINSRQMASQNTPMTVLNFESYRSKFNAEIYGAGVDVEYGRLAILPREGGTFNLKTNKISIGRNNSDRARNEAAILISGDKRSSKAFLGDKDTEQINVGRSGTLVFWGTGTQSVVEAKNINLNGKISTYTGEESTIKSPKLSINNALFYIGDNEDKNAKLRLVNSDPENETDITGTTLFVNNGSLTLSGKFKLNYDTSIDLTGLDGGSSTLNVEDSLKFYSTLKNNVKVGDKTQVRLTNKNAEVSMGAPLLEKFLSFKNALYVKGGTIDGRQNSSETVINLDKVKENLQIENDGETKPKLYIASGTYSQKEYDNKGLILSVENLKATNSSLDIEPGSELYVSKIDVVNHEKHQEVNVLGKLTLSNFTKKMIKLDLSRINVTDKGSLIFNNGNYTVQGISHAQGNTLIHKGAFLNVNNLAVSNGKFSVDGTLNIKDLNGEKSSVVLRGIETLLISSDGEINIDTKTANSLFNKETSTVNPTYWLDMSVKNEGDIRFNFDDSIVFKSTEDITKFKNSVARSNKGSIYVGNAKIVGGDEIFDKEGDVIWDKAKAISDISTAKTEHARVKVSKNAAQSGELKGTFGSFMINEPSDLKDVKLGNHTVLTGDTKGDNIFIKNNKGEVLGANVQDNVSFTLRNDGTIGDIKLGKKSTLNTFNGKKIIGNIKGDQDSSFVASGDNYTYSIDVDNFQLAKKGNLDTSKIIKDGPSIGYLSARNINFKEESTANVGKLYVESKNGDANANIEGNVKATQLITKDSNKTTVQIKNNGKLSVRDILLADNKTTILVGNETKGVSEDPEFIQGSTGTLVAENATLKGGLIYADPDFGQKSSLVVVKNLTDQAKEKVDIDAGVLDGKIIAGRNSIVAIGYEDEDIVYDVVKPLLNENLGLDGVSEKGTGLGALLVLNKNISIDQKQGGVVLTTKQLDPKNLKVTENTFDFGDNTAIVLKGDNLSQDSNNAAIKFTGNSATITYGGDKKNTIYLSGNIKTGNFGDGKGYKVFGGAKAGVNDQNKVIVSSLSGIFEGSYNKVTHTIDSLMLNKDKLAKSFEKASLPVRDFIKNTINTGDTKERSSLGFAYVNNVVFDSSTGQSIDKQAHMGTYAGAQLGTLNSQTMAQNAIANHLISSYGSQGSSPQASNNNFGNVWASPTLNKISANKLKAEGVTYGTDINAAGLAVGAEMTSAKGVIIGAMLNTSMGSATGKNDSNANGLKNNYDFYGVGFYSHASISNFNISADITVGQSTSKIKTDSGLSDFGDLNAHVKTSVASLGIGAEYVLSTPASDIVPHASVRYSRLNTKDYNISSSKKGDFSSISTHDQNMLSIPFGVTFEKSYVLNSGWKVTPIFDVSMTANIGDKDAKAKTSYSGLANDINTTTQVVDPFSYSATLGTQASIGNFGVGFNVNYQGSQSTNSMGVNGSILYTF